MIARLLALLALILLGAAPVAAQPVRTGHLEAQLVRQTQWAAPGSTVHIALVQDIDDGWHTYWTNPGDTGQATDLQWATPPGVRIGEVLWPTPERILTEAGDMRFSSYAYTGRVVTPIAVEVPAFATPGQELFLSVTATFYVCSDTLCVPETGRLSVSLPVREGRPPLDGRWGQTVTQALETAPQPSGIQGRVSTVGGVVSLAFTGPELTGIDADGAYFLPMQPGVLNQASVQRVERGARGLTLSAPAAQSLVPLTGPVEGVLATAAGSWRVVAEPGAAPADAHGLGSARPAPLNGPFGGAAPAQGLLAILGFAVLGGLILNLMPCVFPVLSMKAAGLAASAADPARARAEGLAFLAGVILAFLGLAAALLVARAGGQAVGWGFHLQSPLVVALLALVMLAAGLNLSGLYHLGASAQRLGTEAGLRLEGPLSRIAPWLGSALTGALAVVVAAPCTAPFMGAALGWALTQSAGTALLVFAALGLGFGLPYALICLWPGLLRALPRPGAWLGRAKALLALPMYGAALWLGWVFLRQAGGAATGLVAAAALVALAGLWLYGRRQRASAEGWRVVPALAPILIVAVLSLGLATAGALAATPPERTGPAGEAWSQARVAAARAEGRVVFVNFTADWCLSCKTNEFGALSSDRVRRAIERTDAVYLVADWTRRDAAIAGELARHGRSGVPLYLVYGPTGEAEVLPQLLTDGAVAAALDRAAAQPRTAASPPSVPAAR